MSRDNPTPAEELQGIFLAVAQAASRSTVRCYFLTRTKSSPDTYVVFDQDASVVAGITGAPLHMPAKRRPYILYALLNEAQVDEACAHLTAEDQMWVVAEAE